MRGKHNQWWRQRARRKGHASSARQTQTHSTNQSASSNRPYQEEAQNDQQSRRQQSGSSVPRPPVGYRSILDTALKILLSLIDYSILAQDPPSMEASNFPEHTIMADSLNYLEALQRLAISGWARNAPTYVVYQNLKRRIPRQHFIEVGVQQVLLEYPSFVPSTLAIVQATMRWIHAIKDVERRNADNMRAASTQQEDLEEGELISGDEIGMDTVPLLQAYDGRAGAQGSARRSSFAVRAPDGDWSRRRRVRNDSMPGTKQVGVMHELSGPTKDRGHSSPSKTLQEASMVANARALHTGNPAEAENESEQMVERFQGKLEQWIQLWQNGTFEGDAWDTMKDCMDLQD